MDRPRPPRRSAGRPPRGGGRAPDERGDSGRRFTPQAIAAAVRELDAGVPAPLVCRRFGVSDRTLYRWRRRIAPEPERPA